MNPVIILSPVGAATKPVLDGVIGGKFTRSPAGFVYVYGWWSNPNESMLADGDTIVNLTVSPTLSSECSAAFDEKKAVVIHGFTDSNKTLNDFGFILCNEDGSDVVSSDE